MSVNNRKLTLILFAIIVSHRYDVSMMTTKSHEGLFRKIPREDLMITQKTNQSLPQDVYLQVGLKSHLLRTGLELVVAPTSINEQSIEQFLVQCRNDYHALSIYCLDGKRPLNQLVSYILKLLRTWLHSVTGYTPCWTRLTLPDVCQGCLT